MKLFTILLILGISNIMMCIPNSIPFSVLVRCQTSEFSPIKEDELYWEAWKESSPGDILTNNSSNGSKYFIMEDRNESVIQIQTSDFQIPMGKTETIHVLILNLKTGAIAHVTQETELETSFIYYKDLVILSTENAPPAPVISSLLSETEVEAGVVLLKWENIDRATGYKLYLGVNSNYMTEIADISETEYEIEVKSGVEYYWSVEPYNENGTSVIAKTFIIQVK